MRWATMLGVLAVLGLGAGELRAAPMEMARVRTVLHKDGSRTVSTQDLNARELEELTYSQRRVIVQRKRFLLDDQSRAIQGVIFDGGGDLVARVEFGFDGLGRMTEERTYNAKGEVVRRLLYRYNAMGIQSKPIAFTFDTSGAGRAPVMMDPGEVQPTIVTPNINGVREVAGDRYYDGLMEAETASTRPTLPPPRIQSGLKRR